MAGAADVWEALRKYKAPQAANLLVAYGTKEKIIAKLESYPDKGKYHGHGTKPAGGDAPVALAAQTAQKNALAFLEKHKPAEPPVAKKAVPDAQKRGANQKEIADLMAILTRDTDIPTMTAALTTQNAGWKTLPGVNAEFERFKAARKAAKTGVRK